MVPWVKTLTDKSEDLGLIPVSTQWKERADSKVVP